MVANRRFSYLLFSVAVGAAIALWSPPAGVTQQAWFLFAVFVSTILAVVLGAMPMGACTLMALAVLTASGVMPFDKAFAFYGHEVVWLVLIAFFIANGFTTTGLGKRIAFIFVKLFGRRTLGLAYGISLAELALAPAIPAVSARTGGIIYPIVRSLSEAFDSRPKDGSARRLGAFLVLSAYNCAVVTSAMFLTGMAANPLVARLAQDAGAPISWGTWALGAIVPGLVSLALVPFILYRFYPPEIKDTPYAVQMAKDKLQEMGPMSRNEKIMLVTIFMLIVLWTIGPKIGLSATVSGLLGLTFLLVFRVLIWEDLLKITPAFETFMWYGGLIAMADGLKTYGLAGWYGDFAAAHLSQMGWVEATAILFLIYFFTHYFFASGTAHVGALFLPFVMASIGLGAPKLPVVLIFAYGSNLMGSLTHYGLSTAPILYGSGYVSMKAWWKWGFILGCMHIVIWSTLGSLWWHWLGYF